MGVVDYYGLVKMRGFLLVQPPVVKLVQFDRTSDACQSCFSDFVFKIRLIRLGFSFSKQKFLYLNSQPTDSQSGVIPTTPQSQI